MTALRYWPFSDGRALPKEDTQAAAFGESCRSARGPVLTPLGRPSLFARDSRNWPLPRPYLQTLLFPHIPTVLIANRKSNSPLKDEVIGLFRRF